MIAKHLDWWLVLSAFALAPILWFARGHVPVAGDEIDADLTLITADKPDLSCALEGAVGGHRCRYPWPPGHSSPHLDANNPIAASPLQPFLTLNRTMYLIADLFAQPALAQRFARELPDGRPRAAYHRFTAKCRLRLLRQVAGASVQFGSTAAWQPMPPLWVVKPITCSVVDG